MASVTYIFHREKSHLSEMLMFLRLEGERDFATGLEPGRTIRGTGSYTIGSDYSGVSSTCI